MLVEAVGWRLAVRLPWRNDLSIFTYFADLADREAGLVIGFRTGLPAICGP